MVGQANDVVLLLGIAVIALIVSGLLSLRMRQHVLGGAAALVVVFGTGAWLFCHALELATDDLAAKIMWRRLQLVGATVVTPAWLVFIARHLGWWGRKRRRLLGVLLVPAPLVWLLAVTDHWHGSFLRGGALVSREWTADLEPVWGWAMWAQMAYASVLVLLSAWLLWRGWRGRTGLYRRRAGSLLGVSAVAWSVIVGDLMFGPLLPPLQMGTLALALMGLGVVWLLPVLERRDIAAVSHDLVFESLGDGVVVLDAEGRILDVNRATERTLGRGRGRLLATPVRDWFPQWSDDGRPEFRLEVPRASPEDGEREAVAVEVKLTDLSDTAGRLVARVGVLRDTSARWWIARDLLELQRLETLRGFAAGVAHEFNNTLAVIRSRISLVDLELEPGSRSADHLASAAEASRRAAELVEKLSGMVNEDATDSGPTALGEVAREWARYVTGPSLIRCTIQEPADLWPVHIERSRAGQVFCNLLVNAREAMSGGGEIRIGLENVVLTEPLEPLGLTPGRYVCATLEDTGPGIPAATAAEVFEPFFTTKRTGTGLGLATVRTLTTAAGGGVELDAEYRQGTRFRLWFRAGEPDRTAEPREAVVPATRHRGRGRILVMDDEREVRETLGAMLRSMGYSAVLTDDGLAAVNAERAALDEGVPFHLAFLDLTVPGGVGGIEAAHHLLELDPKLRLVLTSGYVDELALRKSIDQTFLDVLPKPYDLQDVAAVLERFLRPTARSGGAESFS